MQRQAALSKVQPQIWTNWYLAGNVLETQMFLLKSWTERKLKSLNSRYDPRLINHRYRSASVLSTGLSCCHLPALLCFPTIRCTWSRSALCAVLSSSESWWGWVCDSKPAGLPSPTSTYLLFIYVLFIRNASPLSFSFHPLATSVSPCVN